MFDGFEAGPQTRRNWLQFTFGATPGGKAPKADSCPLSFTAARTPAAMFKASPPKKCATMPIPLSRSHAWRAGKCTS